MPKTARLGFLTLAAALLALAAPLGHGHGHQGAGQSQAVRIAAQAGTDGMTPAIMCSNCL